MEPPVAWENASAASRRYRKFLEESPSVQLSEELRQRIGTALQKRLSSISYANTGTVAFLMDENSAPHSIEMNTRFQMEYP